MNKLIPTPEQELIIAAAKEGKNLCLTAYAGAAKTATCLMIADILNKPSLYISFNKSIATEASERFPSHVACRTMHSLAYSHTVTKAMRKRLQGFFDVSDIRALTDYALLPLELADDIAYQIVDIITHFCRSDSFNLIEFTDKYLLAELLLQDADAAIHKVGVDIISSLTLDYWDVLTSEKSTAKVTHDGYLKLFQLSKPALNYSVIYLDEAQDSNPVILDIVLRQKHAQTIIVGDTYQSIYQWRGAINALQKVPLSFERLYLTTSFRFTQDIADKATKILSYMGNDKQIIGNATEGDCVTKAILVRTNAGLLACLINLQEAGEKTYVLADLRDLWAKVYHIQSLYYNSPIKYPAKELKQYKTYADLLKASKYQKELDKLVKLTIFLCKQPNGLHATISKIKSCIIDNAKDAAVTLCTIHKSKGLEWDEVTIMDDVLMDSIEEEELSMDQLGNLIYVAITRAKYKVNVPSPIQELL